MNPFEDAREMDEAHEIDDQFLETRSHAPAYFQPLEQVFDQVARLVTPRKGCWGKIHADQNGAYNILRKANPRFRVSRELSSEFILMRMARRGLVRISS